MQSQRISDAIDGNVRTMANNLTISGTVDRSAPISGCKRGLDTNAKIGRSLTAGRQTLTVDERQVGRDFLSFSESTTISGMSHSQLVQGPRQIAFNRFRSGD